MDAVKDVWMSLSSLVVGGKPWWAELLPLALRYFASMQIYVCVCVCALSTVAPLWCKGCLCYEEFQFIINGGSENVCSTDHHEVTWLGVFYSYCRSVLCAYVGQSSGCVFSQSLWFSMKW